MVRSVLSWFTGLVRSEDCKDGNGGDDSNSGDDSGDDGGFRPSRLDASVLFAHGKRVGDLDGDAADIEAEAREIEKERRKHE